MSRRLRYILAHPVRSMRWVRACRAPWPTLEVEL